VKWEALALLLLWFSQAMLLVSEMQQESMLLNMCVRKHCYVTLRLTLFFFFLFPMDQQPLVGQGLL
jgi:hypothetical protein